MGWSNFFVYRINRRIGFNIDQRRRKFSSLQFFLKVIETCHFFPFYVRWWVKSISGMKNFGHQLLLRERLLSLCRNKLSNFQDFRQKRPFCQLIEHFNHQMNLGFELFSSGDTRQDWFILSSLRNAFYVFLWKIVAGHECLGTSCCLPHLRWSHRVLPIKRQILLFILIFWAHNDGLKVPGKELLRDDGKLIFHLELYGTHFVSCILH